MRRIAAISACALLALTMAVPTAYAGKTGEPNDGGAKNGTGNKENYRGCPDDYTLVDSSSYWYSWEYDLNRDLYVCYKVVGGATNYIDNMSNRKR